MPEGYDESTGAYVGPCADCGTDHRGTLGPETLGGRLECFRAQAETLGDDDLMGRVQITSDWFYTAQANALGLPVLGLD